jgi:hypothetical protein
MIISSISFRTSARLMPFLLYGVLLFASHCLLIKLLVALARAVKHDIELQTGQSQISTNPFLIVFGQVESEEHLDVSFAVHLFEYLPDDIGFLFPQQFFELVGCRMEKWQGLLSQTLLPRGTLEIFDHPVSGHTADETGEFLRLSNASVSNLFQDDAEGLLIEIISDGGVSDFPADDACYEEIIGFDQFGLGFPITSLNAADEISPAANLTYSHGSHLLISCDFSPMTITVGRQDWPIRPPE